MILGIKLDGRSEVLLSTLEVLHVERLDGALLVLKGFLLALRDRIHNQLKLLLGAAHVRGVVPVELESFLEGIPRPSKLVHSEERGSLARVALGPVRLQPNAILRIGECLVILFKSHVGSSAVRVENVILRIEFDGLFEEINCSLVVLFVEILDGALLALKRLALPRHLLGDGIHDCFELLLQSVVSRIEIEALLENRLCNLELAHAKENRTSTEVPLCPIGLQPDALVSVLHCLVIVLKGDIGSAAVGKEDVRLLVEGEGDCEMLHGTLILL
mmetsp:Transcript_40817/g.67800  ORF Transcript_40817/g.67800 Transcript_40817/m.67800 type:complete len:273 (-) Transcript_40817:1208-2026(-)